MTDDPLAIPAFLRRTPASPEERDRSRARAAREARAADARAAKALRVRLDRSRRAQAAAAAERWAKWHRAEATRRGVSVEELKAKLRSSSARKRWRRASDRETDCG